MKPDVVKNVLKICSSFLVLGLFLYLVGLERFMAAFSKLDVSQFLIAFVLTSLVSISQSLRLYTLVSSWVNGVFGLLRIGFVSQFFSNFLPGGFTGDLYKVYVFRSQNRRRITESATLVFVDRFAGLISTFFVFGWSIFFIANMTYTFNRVYLISFITLSGLFLVAASWQILPTGIKDRVIEIGVIFRGLSRKQLSSFLTANLLVSIFRFIKFYFLAHLIGIDLSIIQSAFLIVAVHLSSILPLSMGGYGLLEGAIVIVIVNFGYSVDSGVMLAVLNRVGVWGCSIIGGLDWMQAVLRRNVFDTGEE